MSRGPGDSQHHKRAIGEQIWLNYYNQALLERGVINGEEYNRMAGLINARVVAGSRGNQNASR